MNTSEESKIRTPCEEFEEIYWDHITNPKPDKSMLLALYRCLEQATADAEPFSNTVTLSKTAVRALTRSIDTLLGGRQDNLLQKANCRSDTHLIDGLHCYAVSYVKTCRKHGYDDAPVKTICEQFDIDPRTYSRWQKDCPEATDDMTKRKLRYLERYAEWHKELHS